MHFFLSYSEDLNYNPLEYTDNNFIYDIKGTYQTKLIFFDKLVPSSHLKYLNRKNGSIIQISDFGIKNPESKWLNWEDIDYIKARKNRLELSSRTGDIVNINYRIEDFDLIALKILKLATPLEALNWFKQVTFKPQKTIFYYLKYYIFVVHIIMAILFWIWLPFLLYSPEGSLIALIVFTLFCWYLAYLYIRRRFFVSSISIKRLSIIFYKESIFMNAIFPNFSNPNKYEFDISDITNIIIETSSYELPKPLYLTISLLKRDGNIISLIPGTGPDSVDPIPIYYRLKSILLKQE